MIPKEVWRQVRRIQIRTGRAVTGLLAGAYRSAFKGRGMEFEDVREYQPGDEVRTIDWNVTARMNSPFVKNFREERELSVMIIVDVSSSGQYGSSGRKKRELIAELGALLALSAVRGGDKVGLVLFTDRVELYLPPKKGTTHTLRLIRELLAYEPKGSGTDLKGALTFLARVKRRRGVSFLISDFIAPGAAKEVALIARRHDLTALCVSDPREFDFPDVGLVQIRDLETGLTRMIDTSREEVRARLKGRALSRIEGTKALMDRVGAAFVHLRTDEDLLPVLHRAFRSKERRA